MPGTFGIDFGTTNTRVAYYDGGRVRAVPFDTSAGTAYHLPTLISYQGGEPVAVGADARTAGTLFPDPLKWLLGPPEPVEVDGGTRHRVQVVADFLARLRRLVEAALDVPLAAAAVTVPVHYPPAARNDLAQAFRAAGIEVTHFFPEPIAAIYAGLLGDRPAGVAAVFDWGGGSLDVATVRVRDGVAMTRRVDGWHRGGTHFDRAVAERAVDDFLARHRDIREGTDQLLGIAAGRTLMIRAEAAKIALSRADAAQLVALKFLAGRTLDYRLTRAEFDELIGPDLTGAVARLDRVLRDSGVTPRTLARLFLSGGTCHIPAVRDRLAAQVAGHLTVDTLRLPPELVDPLFPGGLDDIGNATAIGAALLAVHGAEPQYASAVGVRLAGGDGPGFFPVFHAGEAVRFGPVRHRFFVSDASAEVARLLVCEQDDPVAEPGGRLAAQVVVPVDRDEEWLEVEFTMDRSLVLRVDAAGRRSLPHRPDQAVAWPRPPAWLPALNLGFRLPGFAG